MKKMMGVVVIGFVAFVLALASVGCSEPPPRQYGRPMIEMAEERDRQAAGLAPTPPSATTTSPGAVIPPSDPPETSFLSHGDSIWRRMSAFFWRLLGSGGLLFFGVAFCAAALVIPGWGKAIPMAFGLMWAYFANTGPRAQAAESVGTLCILFAISGLAGAIPSWKKIAIPLVLIGGYFLLIIMDFITWTFS